MNRRYCNGMVHVIKPGDTLYQLSRYYRIPMAMLLRANPYVDVYNLQVGQEICIPMVRAHRGMICMPVPKDEPLPVTAIADETETETQVQSQEESSAKVFESENAENEPEKVAEEPAAPLPKFTDNPGAIPCNAASAFAVGILFNLSP